MNALRLLPLLVLTFALSPGAIAEEADEPRRDAALALTIRRVKAVREADHVVVAEVKDVHDSPGIWCGYLVTHQEVTYRIIETLYGNPAKGDVRVGHLLVGGTSLISKDAPFLRPSVFYPGARFVLCLNRDGEKWAVRDESFGAVAIDPPRQPDPVRTELLRRTLELPALREYLHPEVEGRVPLKVALTDAVPVAHELALFGRRVEFLPPYLLRGAPHLAVTGIEIDEGRALVRFAYAVEGVVGEAQFVRKDGRYVLEVSRVVER